jgi:hypothetical protein
LNGTEGTEIRTTQRESPMDAEKRGINRVAAWIGEWSADNRGSTIPGVSRIICNNLIV